MYEPYFHAAVPTKYLVNKELCCELGFLFLPVTLSKETTVRDHINGSSLTEMIRKRGFV